MPSTHCTMRASKCRSSLPSFIIIICLHLLSITNSVDSIRGHSQTAASRYVNTSTGQRELKTKGKKVKKWKGPTSGNGSSKGKSKSPLFKKKKGKSKSSKGNINIENCPDVSNLVPNPRTCSVSCVSNMTELATVLNANTVSYQTVDVKLCANTEISWGPSDSFTLKYDFTHFIMRCCGAPCVFDGKSRQSVSRSLPMFSFTGHPVTIEIRGITFQNVNYTRPSNSSSAIDVGAVLDVHATSSVHIEDIAVYNIRSNKTAGSIYFSGGSTNDVQIINSLFSGNTATGGFGAAISIISGVLGSYNNIFKGNVADTGAALDVEYSQLISACSFYENNVAVSDGGAIYLGDAIGYLHNDSFVGNIADGNSNDVAVSGSKLQFCHLKNGVDFVNAYSIIDERCRDIECLLLDDVDVEKSDGNYTDDSLHNDDSVDASSGYYNYAYDNSYYPSANTNTIDASNAASTQVTDDYYYSS